MGIYNVGDVVKLRDDLEVDKKYDGVYYTEKMNAMKNKPIKLLGYDNCIAIAYYVEEDGETWYLTEKMIEGLWEECKPNEQVKKLRLIDVLNMIAKGELKEGTKVIIDNKTFVYGYQNHIKVFSNEIRNEYLDVLQCLGDEVELIEPEHICEDKKMIEDTQIPELDISELEIEGVDDLAFAFENMCDQLNKAIRKSNEQTKVILALEKDINEIKEQLDY